ncbi:chloramphenicol phosphotransferase CPT family protein [Peribacillus deserti]|uniref:Chloramphenicol phosphotransferase n=1 Tax=Peribacillus deserti TaxID=673318 RepID=A0A2N5M6D8_9BACI|nr:AAA family ATPase [Peribacillus deserti]PLT29892.1 chloramphenicol phosphotransferase [Peribacillus deserti]
MEKGMIIVLNGVSSSGKSTLAKEITKLLPDFFAFSVDDYDLIIEKMEDRDNQRLIPVETEYFYYRNVAMFSDRGINLILDQILHDPITLQTFYKTLNTHPILLVGVHCPAEELKRREHFRGDRQIGQAISQLNFVHQQEIYDVEINTYTLSMMECAKEIVDRLQTPLLGFKKSLEKFESSRSKNK